MSPWGKKKRGTVGNARANIYTMMTLNFSPFRAALNILSAIAMATLFLRGPSSSGLALEQKNWFSTFDTRNTYNVSAGGGGNEIGIRERARTVDKVVGLSDELNIGVLD
jgi:hypothetical protein